MTDIGNIATIASQIDSAVVAMAMLKTLGAFLGISLGALALYVWYALR